MRRRNILSSPISHRSILANVLQIQVKYCLFILLRDKLIVFDVTDSEATDEIDSASEDMQNDVNQAQAQMQQQQDQDGKN